MSLPQFCSATGLINRIKDTLTTTDNSGRTKIHRFVRNIAPPSSNSNSNDDTTNSMIIENVKTNGNNDHDHNGKSDSNVEDDILRLQQEMGARNTEECDPMFKFLDVLNISRREVYAHLFAAQKAELLKQIELLSEPHKLQILNLVFTFLKVESLKFLPLFILRNVSAIHEKRIEDVVNWDNGRHLSELPIHIKRQIWEMKRDIFRPHIKAHCTQFVSAITPYYLHASKVFGKNPFNKESVVASSNSNSNNSVVILDKQRRDSSLNRICEDIGKSKKLTDLVYRLCIEENLNEHNQYAAAKFSEGEIDGSNNSMDVSNSSSNSSGSSSYILGVWSVLLRTLCRKSYNIATSHSNSLVTKLYELSILLDRVYEEQFEAYVGGSCLDNSSTNFKIFSDEIGQIVKILVSIIKEQGKLLENEYEDTVVNLGFEYNNFFDDHSSAAAEKKELLKELHAKSAGSDNKAKRQKSEKSNSSSSSGGRVGGKKKSKKIIDDDDDDGALSSEEDELDISASHKNLSKLRSGGSNKGNNEVIESILHEAVDFLIAIDKKGFYPLNDGNKVSNAFSVKVTDDYAPNYSRIIEKPINLKVIKGKISAHHYTNATALPIGVRHPDGFSTKCVNLNSFFRDVERIFLNCQQYNGPLSPYGCPLYEIYGAKFEDQWKMYAARDVIPILSRHCDSFNANIASDNSNASFMLSDKSNSFFYLDKNILGIVPTSIGVYSASSISSIISSTGGGEDIAATGTGAIASVRVGRVASIKKYFDSTKVPKWHEMIKSIKGYYNKVNRLLSFAVNHLMDLDVNNWFSAPVSLLDYPNYLDFVQVPMDFGSIASHIDREDSYTFLQFGRDVERIFSNCFAFNDPTSEIVNYSRQYEEYWNLLRVNLEEALKSVAADNKANISNISAATTAATAAPAKADDSIDKKSDKLKISFKPVADAIASSSLSSSSTSSSTSSTSSSHSVILKGESLDDKSKKLLANSKELSEGEIRSRIKELLYDNSFSSTKKNLLYIMLEMAWNYLVELDETGDFSTVWLNEGVLSIDLGVMRVKIDRCYYKSLGDFDDDVKLLFTLNSRIITQRELSKLGYTYLDIWGETFKRMLKVFENFDRNAAEFAASDPVSSAAVVIDGENSTNNNSSSSSSNNNNSGSSSSTTNFDQAQVISMITGENPSIDDKFDKALPVELHKQLNSFSSSSSSSLSVAVSKELAEEMDEYFGADEGSDDDNNVDDKNAMETGNKSAAPSKPEITEIMEIKEVAKVFGSSNYEENNNNLSSSSMEIDNAVLSTSSAAPTNATAVATQPTLSALVVKAETEAVKVSDINPSPAVVDTVKESKQRQPTLRLTLNKKRNIDAVDSSSESLDNKVGVEDKGGNTATLDNNKMEISSNFSSNITSSTTQSLGVGDELLEKPNGSASTPSSSMAVDTQAVSASSSSSTDTTASIKVKKASIKLFVTAPNNHPAASSSDSNTQQQQQQQQQPGAKSSVLKLVKKQLPKPDRMLVSYREAFTTLTKMENSPSGVTYLPDLLLDDGSNSNSLLFAVNMLKDSSIQLLFRRYLVESMKHSILSVRSVSSGAASQLQLPFHNKTFRLASQLSQIPFMTGDRLISVDNVLLRCIFPFLILETAKEFDTVPAISQPRETPLVQEAINNSVTKLVDSVVSKCEDLISKGLLMFTQQSTVVKAYEEVFLKFIESIATELLLSTRTAIIHASTK